MAPLVESQQCRHEDDRHEARDGAGPVDPKRIVHGSGEEGESGGRARADDGGGGEGRRGVAEIGVHNVVGQAHVEEDHAKAGEDTRADGDEPEGGRVVGPGEPEEADGQAHGAQHGRRETGLGGRFTAALFDDLGVAPLIVQSRVEEGDDNAQCHGQEGQGGHALGPAAGLLEDDGIGCEQQEHGALHNGQKRGEKGHDGLQEEQQERAKGADLQLAENSLLLAHAIDEMGLAEDGSHLGRSPAEEGGSEGLGKGAGHGDERRAGQRRDEDRQRAPPERMVEVPTEDRTKHLTHQTGEGEEGQDKSSLVGCEHVGNNGWCTCLGKGASNTSQETKTDDELDGVDQANDTRQDHEYRVCG